MKRFLKRAALGCLGLTILALVIFAVVATVMVSLGPPESRREEGIAPVLELPEAARPAPGEVAVPVAGLEVELDLWEGRFLVLPGEPGTGIRIDSDYEAGIYELSHQVTEGPDGVHSVRISFRSRYSVLRRLLTVEDLDVENRITIYLPPDVPMRLSGVVARGDSDLNLSGLSLAELDLEFKQGDHDIRLEEPNPIQMDSLRLRMSMGDFKADGLGNARFRRADVETSMGDIRLDFQGEAYDEDATVQVHHSMGELRLFLPDNVRVDLRPVRVWLGEYRKGFKESTGLPENVPTVGVTASVSMGGISIRN